MTQSLVVAASGGALPPGVLSALGVASCRGRWLCSQGKGGTSPRPRSLSNQGERKVSSDKVDQNVPSFQSLWQQGSNPSVKRKENATSKVGRVRDFLAYMGAGKNKLHLWNYLDNPERIFSYAASLQPSKTVTTAAIYLKNSSQFMKYFQQTPPKQCRLSRGQIVGVIRALDASKSNIQTPVVLHQLKVKSDKLSRLVSRETLRNCQMRAEAAIPKLLDCMERGNSTRERYAFFGHLSALLASLYGHRPGVFRNMTVTEVLHAAEEEECEADTITDPGYVISVAEHKTNRDFGAAQIYLRAEEYSWFKKWLAVRGKCNPTTDHFMVGDGGGPVTNLLQCMQGAWIEMGLPGRPNFMDLRTAVAAHAKNFHPEDVRRRIATFMCHDVSTADRFYTLVLNPRQAKQLRIQLEEVVANPDPPCASSATEIIPV
ncbi:uncharacterized protein LOC134135276 isoform X1 [Pungitius pungitius]|uniref:uncharacterized protein LOC134106014 isoform X1 n=1 Tax=Pungitius pungitius TaxID=134920 RepID=UPI002E0F33EC